MTNTKDNFIMLPTVDFCFKELMRNPKVRKGFIAALLDVEPEQIRETTLQPNELPLQYEKDKLGILDVHVQLDDGTKMNFEMQVARFENWNERILFYLSKIFSGQLNQGETYEKMKKCIHVSILDFIHYPEDDVCYRKIHFRDEETGKIFTDKMEFQILELKKLPKEAQNEEGVLAWMRFLSRKNKEEFEQMAKMNEYFDEAYNELLELSADEKKRMEYEARDKAIRDYNSQMESSLRRGIRQGREEGRKAGVEEGRREGRKEGINEGLKLAQKILKLQKVGENEEKIAEICGLTVEQVREILA